VGSSETLAGVVELGLKTVNPEERQKKPTGMSRGEWKSLKRQTREAIEEKRVNSAKQKIDRAETEAERVLAHHLAAKKIKFEPQYKIGDYRVDFFVRPNIAIEVNGSVHRTLEVYYKDRFKRGVLEKQGYLVLAISNLSVMRNGSKIAESIGELRSKPFSRVRAMAIWEKLETS
jgi:very-short-patch-repair endonuclease